MSYTHKNVSEEAFRQQIISYYGYCHIDQDVIDLIMREHSRDIGLYTMATPELVARKFYQETTGEIL